MNELPKSIETGTFGEIFCQLKLLQFGVQAAPPIKDTGNDLIAVRGNWFNSIQVKSTFTNFPINFKLDKLPEKYHLLAIVCFPKVQYHENSFDISLDSGRIFLLPKDQVTKGHWSEENLSDFEICPKLINIYFPIE